MKRNIGILIILFIVFILFEFSTIPVLANPDVNTENNLEENTEGQRRKLEDLKNELKEQRKIIEQQRLEEIKAKELEKQQNAKDSINDDKVEQHKTEDNSSKVEDKGKEEIPTLIVRLRGKHSTKYLCYYNFVKKENNNEKILAKELISSHEKLLKKPALKVRPGEILNFEFSVKPKDTKVYIWDENLKKVKINRGCIRVPDLDEKIVVAVDGIYKDGYIRYAIILDIRK